MIDWRIPAAILCLAPVFAMAQQSADPTPPAASEAAPSAAPAPKGAKTAQMEAGEPRAGTSAAPAAPAAAGKSARTAAGREAPKGNDRVELDTTTVTGNRELPKVMYVVPWKKSDIGDLVGKPMNSLLDEVLTPVDRDVFRREVRYYDAVKADSNQNGAPAAGPPGKQVEK
jgi:hypothetical protein